MKGAAMTHGEEQEQTNAKFSRYLNSIKYMNKAGILLFKKKSLFYLSIL